jgi:hypothetical protein
MCLNLVQQLFVSVCECGRKQFVNGSEEAVANEPDVSALREGQGVLLSRGLRG